MKKKLKKSPLKDNTSSSQKDVAQSKEETNMEKYIGIDAGTRTSNICVISAEKKVLKELVVSNKLIGKEIKDISGLKHCIIETGPLSEFICEQIEL